MKEVAVTLLLVLCGFATATNLLKRQNPDACEPSTTFIVALSNNCPAFFSNTSTVLDVCNDNCFGRICDYYDSANFPSSCMLPFIEICENAGLFVPRACQSNPCLRFTDAFLLDFISECPAILGNPTTNDLCTDNCFGNVCNYYKENNFPSSCLSDAALECQLGFAPIPDDCDIDAVVAPDACAALLTFKGVLAAVLLLTAFFIF